MDIVLPKTKVTASQINPKRLVIYSKPKSGKTTCLANLENNLIIDLENGSDYVDALKVKVNNLEELIATGKQIKADGRPYKYVTIDTVTALEEMILPLARKIYCETPMGKSFKGDDVRTLANGAGYHYLRTAFFQVLDFIDTLADHIILVGHLKEKAIDDKGELVMAANIDLTGKIKSLVCANADAIGYMTRKGNQTILNFKSNDEVTCGARPLHLRDQEIVLSELNDGLLKTNWNQIYL